MGGKALIRPVSDNKNTKIQNWFCFSIRVCPIRIDIFNIFHLTFVINNCVSSDSSNSRNGPIWWKLGLYKVWTPNPCTSLCHRRHKVARHYRKLWRRKWELRKSKKLQSCQNWEMQGQSRIFQKSPQDSNISSACVEVLFKADIEWGNIYLNMTFFKLLFCDIAKKMIWEIREPSRKPDLNIVTCEVYNRWHGWTGQAPLSTLRFPKYS